MAIPEAAKNTAPDTYPIQSEDIAEVPPDPPAARVKLENLQAPDSPHLSFADNFLL
jgi:hypothetical protein